jgi:hypothetical protein
MYGFLNGAEMEERVINADNTIPNCVSQLGTVRQLTNRMDMYYMWVSRRTEKGNFVRWIDLRVRDTPFSHLTKNRLFRRLKLKRK